MYQFEAQDMCALIEEHIPNPDRFEISLCTADGGESFGVYIDDLASDACALLEDEDQAHDLVMLMQAANDGFEPGLN